ncbi:MAG TPA: arylsulfatase [Segeticoccus sp.]|uniref:arylsulfatase n=1 Tax=Segeticoccus sp. TaxID=2706531 RepID=UPI002D7FFF1C|nr:arylsulfatase [Segeticoccus sp.]HET8598686.1 arylsulfatase [Segeticoccus sp.]
MNPLPTRSDVSSRATKATNVVLVVVDDMGFGASSAFGGPCRMPTAERLAREGLRYSRFHVTALCSPTRQALLTGRNHHSVGMGGTTEMATAAPGYTSVRPATAATTAQILNAAGYSTAAFGKWHQTPAGEVSEAGPFDRWPTGEGFEHFYGFMGAEMNHWYPQLYRQTTPVEPTRTPEDGYHLSEDLVDDAVDWVRTQQVLTPHRPFFAYLAFGATHAPFHVASSWRDRYRGQFDHGWDRQRELTLQRQRELGIVPPDAELAPWAQDVPHWDELDDTRRAVAARFMETYAGFAEHTDAQVGRLVDALAELEVLDDTVFLYLLGDNGASGEGGVDGTLREHLVGHGFVDDVTDMAARLDHFGDATTYGLYPVGWALAMNTPYQWTKQVASHYGGTRDGLVLRWGDHVPDPGGVRHQWHHVIDVLPTVLELAGVPEPQRFAGVDQQPLEGTSFAYTLADAEAAERHTTQYFEMCANRGVYHEGWTAVTRHGIPWVMVPEGLPAFEDDVWELYDTTRDWTQSRDLAAQEPERLRELQALFVQEASRYQVFPLDDRVTERENPEVAGRPSLFAGRRSVTYRPGMGRFTEEATLNTKNVSHAVTASLTITDERATGVLVAQGGRFGGWSMYLRDGHLCYAYNCYGRDLVTVRSEAPVPMGPHELRVEFEFDGGAAGAGADVTLHDGAAQVGAGRLERTTAYYFSFDETLNVGVDRGTPVTEEYAPLANGFEGDLAWVRIELRGEPTPLDRAERDLKARAHQ